MKKTALLLWLLISVAGIKKACGQQLPEGTIQVQPGNISWKDAKPPFLPGAKITILEGNPAKEGIFTIRFKLPPAYVIPPHFHAREERVTVLSGIVYVGFGDKKEEKGAGRFPAGSFYVNPANSHHFVFTKNDSATLQITGIGPWSIEFLDKK